MRMYRRGLAALLAVLMIAGLCACTGRKNKDGGEVTVQSVAQITGAGALGVIERYAGKVVSGQTEKVARDTNKKVGEVLVAEGDEVKAGAVLFTYDTQALQFSLEKLQLELEGYNNAITAGQAQIEELESERASAGSSQQLAYTLQIQSTQADIREAEYNKGLKEREIANMQASLENTEVRAKISGRVMSVGSVDDTGDQPIDSGDGTGADAFITISDMNTFRVEGNINELNAGTLGEDMSVLIRSRMDETQTWNGTIEKIDWENPVKKDNSSGVYYVGDSGNDEMTNSSKYPFYIALSSKDGLILGQHVYIEPDYGQSNVKTGLWLPEYFLGSTGADAFVWAASRKDTLEKRSVTLGEYDAELGEYEILSGLSTQDYIAFPDDTLEAGMAVVRQEESVSGGMSESMPMEGMSMEGMSMEGMSGMEGVTGEGMSMEGMSMEGVSMESMTSEAAPMEDMSREQTLPEEDASAEAEPDGEPQATRESGTEVG